MKTAALLSLGLLLCCPLCTKAQTTPTTTAPASTGATISDFLNFVRAIRPLQSGQLTSELTMDLSNPNLNVKIRGQIKQVHTSTGKFFSEVSITPPKGAATKHYRVYGSGKTITIHDIDSKIYSTNPNAKEDDFFLRGLLTKLIQDSFANMPPELMKVLDAKTLPDDVTKVLKDKLDEGAQGMMVRSETVDGKHYTVFQIPSGEKKESSPVEIFINESTGMAERLQIKLKQEQLDVIIQERIIKSSPAVPAGTRYVFTPTRGIKKVPKIDVGGFE